LEQAKSVQLKTEEVLEVALFCMVYAPGGCVTYSFTTWLLVAAPEKYQ
jgi:hypothetical protein